MVASHTSEQRDLVSSMETLSAMILHMLQNSYDLRRSCEDRGDVLFTRSLREDLEDIDMLAWRLLWDACVGL